MMANAMTSADPTDKELSFTHQISLPLKENSEQASGLKVASPSKMETTTTVSSTKSQSRTEKEYGSIRPMALSEAFSLTVNSLKDR